MTKIATVIANAAKNIAEVEALLAQRNEQIKDSFLSWDEEEMTYIMADDSVVVATSTSVRGM